MNEFPSAAEFPPPTHASCSVGCRFAAPLRGYPDYVWCTRLHVPRCTTQDDSDCRYFCSPAGPLPPPDSLDDAAPP